MNDIPSMLCPDRRTNIYATAQRCVLCEGDFIECGVHRGGSAAVILRAMRGRGSNAKLHLFDSWEGLSTPSPEDAERLKAGDLKSEIDGDLANQPGVVVHKGFVGEMLEHFPRRIAFAHLDMDLRWPTELALIRTAERLSAGGIIIVDDYDERFPGVMAAVNGFLEKRPDWRHETVAGVPDNAVNIWRNT